MTSPDLLYMYAAAFVLFFLVGMVAKMRFRRLLSRLPPDERIALPPPVMSLDHTPRDGLRFFTAVLTREYRKSPHAAVRRWGDIVLVTFCLYISFMVLAAVTLIRSAP